MPGPAPKHPDERRRRNASPALQKLPANGRPGDAPDFPLGKMTPAVAKLWPQLWATPQAVAWERLGWTRVVARYTRLLIAAERPKAPGQLLAEVRQLEDRLGLTPMAMLRLRWEVAQDELAEVRSERGSARERMQAVEDPSAVAGS